MPRPDALTGSRGFYCRKPPQGYALDSALRARTTSRSFSLSGWFERYFSTASAASPNVITERSRLQTLMEAMTPSTTPRQYPASKPCTSPLQDRVSSSPSSLSGWSGDEGIAGFTMASVLSAPAFTVASVFSASAFRVASVFTATAALSLAKAKPAVRANSRAKLRLKIRVRERFISSPPGPTDVPRRGPCQSGFWGSYNGGDAGPLVFLNSRFDGSGEDYRPQTTRTGPPHVETARPQPNWTSKELSC